MIAFETWWKTAEPPTPELHRPVRGDSPWLRRCLPLVLLGLAACGRATAPDLSQSPSPAPAPVVAADVAAEVAPEASPGLASAPGLIPLPSRDQVLASVPEGRSDPFAPVVPRAGTVGSSAETTSSAIADADATSAPDVSVQGVLQVGGELRALVKTTVGAGTVCVGPRGRCPGDAAALLPLGWSVQAIDLRRGCLDVLISGQTQRRCMA